MGLELDWGDQLGSFPEPEENFMRKLVIAVVGFAAVALAMPLTAGSAQAATMPVPAAIANAIAEVNAAEQVAYVCRRVCDWRGCWRRCYHTAPAYFVYRPYRPYRRHWRHRRW